MAAFASFTIPLPALEATVFGTRLDTFEVARAYVEPAVVVPGTPGPVPEPVAPTILTPPDSLPHEADYGLDISTFPDMDPSLTLQGGRTMLIQALLRRLSTRRGTLAFHPDYGSDLREYLMESVTQDTVQRARSDVIQECEEDERVESADASVTWDAANEVLTIDIAVSDAVGPFDFVLSVNKLAVTLVQGEE